MTGPLIPYWTLPEIPIVGEHTIDFLNRTIGPWTIKPFGALVALGVYLGVLLTNRYARARGIHPEVMSKFIFWVLVFAFVSGHVLDTIFYHPEQVIEDPWSLLRVWDGLSSFGGFMGGVVGIFAFKFRYGLRRVLPLVDTMGAAFPLGWMFGRSGCATVHDHPGIRSEAWFAVQYPDGGRFDLGLYEAVFAAIVAVTCILLARKPRPPPFFAGFLMLSYAPVRFALDFLRADQGSVRSGDPRYFDLTPAQWACFLMVAAGFYFMYRAADSGEVGNEPFEDMMRDVDPRLLEPSGRKHRRSASS